MNAEGGRLLRVEWTQAPEAMARFPEGHMAADDLDDVSSLPNLVYDVLGDRAHSRFAPLLRTPNAERSDRLRNAPTARPLRSTDLRSTDPHSGSRASNRTSNRASEPHSEPRQGTTP